MFLSRVIRWFSGSKASHAWLLLPEAIYGEDMVLEATEGGFRLVPFKSYPGGHVIVKIVEPALPEKAMEAGVKKALSWLGERYDYTGLFGAAFVLLGRRLKQRWHNPLHEPNAMFCSAAVVYVLREAGYPGAETLVPEDTTPQDLLNFLQSGTP